MPDVSSEVTVASSPAAVAGVECSRRSHDCPPHQTAQCKTCAVEVDERHEGVVRCPRARNCSLNGRPFPVPVHAL